jgi:hypothetical protein
MFYEEKEINALIICPSCNHVFDDPRLLECGESMCEVCISLALNKDKTGINCKICKEFHQVPKNGFRKNQRLAKLVEIKPNEVTRSVVAVNFKLQLNKIIGETIVMEDHLKTGKGKINEYCDFIRSEVDLICESWHEYIYKFHDSFFGQIKTYEEECLGSFNNLENNKKTFVDFLIDSNKFHEKWNNYLKRSKIDDSEMITASKDAEMLLSDLNRKMRDLKCQIFNGKLLKFEENESKVNSEIIGKIKYQNIKLFPGQIENFQSLDLKNKLSGFTQGHRVSIEARENGRYSIAYQISNNINVLTIDQNGKILNQRNSIIPSNYGYTKQDLKLLSGNDILFLYSVLYCNDYGTITYRIDVINDQLNSVKNVNHGCVMKDFTFNEKNIFCLSYQNGSYGIITIYDINLGIKQQIGQNTANLPYFFPASIIKFQVNQKFFFLLHNNYEIKLMNRDDGIISKSFQLEGAPLNFQIFSNEGILTYENNSKKMKLYDFDGKKNSEIYFDKLTPNNQLIGISDEKAVFFDSNQMVLNF